jgi:hypothetical protein
MTDQRMEFIVIGHVTGGESGLLQVVGRCGSAPIRLGDRFQALFRHRPRDYPDGLGEAAVREVEKPVSIEVQSIQAYGQDLDELGPGMTGSLGLAGQGIELVEAGWILGQPIPTAVSR